jgi:hypothetical protein
MKTEQARLVLALAESIEALGHPGRRGHPPEVYAFRENIALQVKALNKRGREVVDGTKSA